LKNKIDPIIQKYFPSCQVAYTKKFDEEYLSEITLIEIKSKFGPVSTARREWNMLGELVQIIPKKQLLHFQIQAII